MLFMWDQWYFLYVLLPSLVLSGLTTLYVKLTFARYRRVGLASGVAGAQAARELLDRAGLQSVAVEPSRGWLSDHYDPRQRVVRLSPDVYRGRSLAAVGVACHEAGHAIQHARSFAPMALRSVLVPVAMLGDKLGIILIIIGVVVNMMELAVAGCLLFALVVLFTFVTLPVEWDASRRAKKLMVEYGLVTERERPGAAAVLNAAFLTYVAAAAIALLQLLYLLMRLGLLGGGDD